MRRAAILLGCAVLVTSCRTVEPVADSRSDVPAAVKGGGAVASVHVAFHLESREPGAATDVLPHSGVEVPVEPGPAVTESDLLSVAAPQYELGRGLLFELTAEAAAKLAAATPTAETRRLVLRIDDRPLAVARLPAALTDRRLFFFVEAPESDLPALAAEITAAAGHADRPEMSAERRRNAQ